jgi:hypothetical protein
MLQECRGFRREHLPTKRATRDCAFRMLPEVYIGGDYSVLLLREVEGHARLHDGIRTHGTNLQLLIRC